MFKFEGYTYLSSEKGISNVLLPSAYDFNRYGWYGTSKAVGLPFQGQSKRVVVMPNTTYSTTLGLTPAIAAAGADDVCFIYATMHQVTILTIRLFLS